MPQKSVAADGGKLAGVGGFIAGVAVYFAADGGNQKEKEEATRR